MLNLLLLSFQIKVSITVNRLIHFFRRVPVIKKAFPAGIYGDYTLKSLFAVIAAFFIATRKVLFRLFYFALVVFIGIVLYQASKLGGFSGLFQALDTDGFVEMTAQAVIPYILSVWFMFSFAGAALNSRIIDVKQHDDIMINYLRSHPATYAKAHIFLDRVIDLAIYAPIVLILLAIAGVPLWNVFGILTIFTAFRLMGEALNLVLFRLTGKSFRNILFSILGCSSVFFAAVLAPVWWGIPDWFNILGNLFIVIGSALVGAIMAFYIINYQQYGPFLRETIATYTMQMENMKKQNGNRSYVNLKDAKKWSKDISEEDLQLGRHEKKRGFAYLNAIFFDRHSKYFRKKVRLRSFILVASGAVVILFSLGYHMVTGSYPIELASGITENKSITDYAPIFFFLIYILSMGRVVTASVFSSCDIEMLHYPYYRTKETIYASFKSRFLFILEQNFRITTALSIVTIAASWFVSGSIDFLYAGILFILLTFIGIFFAFNDLFLYYVIQPYDTAGQAKSITYGVINGVVYIVAYTNLQLPVNLMTYSVIVIIATILYLGVGTGALLLFAPKNFKLR